MMPFPVIIFSILLFTYLYLIICLREPIFTMYRKNLITSLRFWGVSEGDKIISKLSSPIHRSTKSPVWDIIFDTVWYQMLSSQGIRRHLLQLFIGGWLPGTLYKKVKLAVDSDPRSIELIVAYHAQLSRRPKDSLEEEYFRRQGFN